MHLGLKLSDFVFNEDLYVRCEITPAGLQVIDARWRLFGNMRRMNENAPARKAMAYYFIDDHAGRKVNRTTIATALYKEYHEVTGCTINNYAQFQEVAKLVLDRNAWKALVKKINDKFRKLYDARVEHKKELRLKESKSALLSLSSLHMHIAYIHAIYAAVYYRSSFVCLLVSVWGYDGEAGLYIRLYSVQLRGASHVKFSSFRLASPN